MSDVAFELPTVETLLNKLYTQLKTAIQEKGIENPRLVGIHSGGVWIAERLQKMLAADADNEKCPQLGTLNIAFYRDDFTERGLHPVVTPSTLPFSVDDANLILVDDVLMSGRTIRAALNELFDYGRPKSVTLAVLVDLQAQELPIKPDAAGMTTKLPANKRIKLRGPDTLKLDLIQTN
ncbi:MAG TPA: bifunctional pyr operon transcriptional regulator/uracil phosphoribosyltransferase PyrR [Gammaproteobacteria bacterium]|nr:bifunctional pyr operon transcriptional regulator/uracil phosphoribosyltransferase [Gammaproteobacteria bacterium]MEC8010631.1 bifunctional pyr operon transcriptional regulator/uracil phosphoribosyltransferase PyrR [Pseudomonadota bacterium]HBF07428.1 bifunctional pyr operon transcriptional regulator/uracil phosphoribosyltransferase PyrR [Gammaproteobacteria bacterium]HCK91597.1 bifunctional pyr operon transcriptional regulator/uracil phosphoribosyltransferase PyrR [Gammaproteobacteria bacter|tara:strand:+ start:5063 stop:5599 length:537 start_codon:yes stop_codon:yes gene_type:complete